ncbi:MAG: thiamine pyrophosphate-dependent dehydrogenase E1 component subunit alpha [Planctomycetota bacterium]
MATADELIGYYRMMLLIRRFEERMEQVFLEGVISGTCHPCIGQEAVAVGAAAALRPDDYMVSNHRGHGHFLARGGDPKRILAEVFGKETGYSKGRGGSQHMASFADGFLGSNGITGGGVPIATGAALALQLQKRDQIVVSFMGDGATNQGAFHEAVNMGAVWKLPIVYLCENNLYAMSTRFDEAFAIRDIVERAPGYGIPGEIVDGNDVLAVKRAVAKAADQARSGEGPTLLECKTYRFCGHSRGDPRKYRSREEEAEWHAKCPIKRMRESLGAMGVLDDASDARIKADVEREIAAAEEFARNSPDPPLDSLEKGVFA